MKKISLLVVVVGFIFCLSGCGGAEKKENAEQASEESIAETTNEKDEIDHSSESVEENELTAADVVQKTIGKSFTDEEQGYIVTVEEMVTNIPGEPTGGPSDGTFFGVACKVKVTSTEEKLLNSFSNDFKLVVGNEVIKKESSFLNFSSYTKEQDWKQLDYSTRHGEIKEGWVIFKLNIKDRDVPLTFRYARPEIPVTVIGGDNYTISAKDFDIEL